MPPALQLGPLLLPVPLLLLIAAAAVAFAVAKIVGSRGDTTAEGVLWQSLLVGLLVARLAFVWQARDAFLAAPLDIVDIRDGGWNAGAGIVGAWLYVLVRLGRRPALRTPLLASMAAGTVLWLTGSVMLAAKPGADAPRLPPLVLTSLQGQPVRLDGFAGKPVVVNLWATWCPPCVREMPVLRKAQAERPGVHIVFVNQLESQTTVAAWLTKNRLALGNVLLDPRGETARAFGAQGMPTTLFFDSDGRLVGTRLGELSSATLAARLADLGVD